MSELGINARIRQGRGRGYRNSLQEKGMIPGVVYGSEVGSIPVEMDSRQVDRILASPSGRSKLIKFSVLDRGDYNVMLKDVQYDPVRREVIHADFQQVNLNQRINTAIPVFLAGEVKEGVLQQVMRELEISCLPAEIPGSITFNVDGMTPGSAVKVADLIIPPGITVLDDGSEIVATVLAGKEETVDVEVPDKDVENQAAEGE
ncbi:LSU ribosomal protein L25p [Desulfocucumis palustris]|uniref:Large ribosomal subunit protein bL25 n=1 Tax=Desulfocucumis palustris TaxID=1898651 RepID=A0A2L2XB07_9FIRM|nr:50S ribosomal protein L25 [Desulfocucumis palustris]GBF32853.1 LSU ribosomal protein L25p [Desulfocucumis palustris]